MNNHKHIFLIGLLGSVISFSSFFEWIGIDSYIKELFAKEKIENTSFNNDALCAGQDGGIAATIPSNITQGEIALVGTWTSYKIKIANNNLTTQFEILEDNQLVKTVTSTGLSYNGNTLEIKRQGDVILFLVNGNEEYRIEREYNIVSILEGQSSNNIILNKVGFSESCSLEETFELIELLDTASQSSPVGRAYYICPNETGVAFYEPPNPPHGIRYGRLVSESGTTYRIDYQIGSGGCSLDWIQLSSSNGYDELIFLGYSICDIANFSISRDGSGYIVFKVDGNEVGTKQNEGMGTRLQVTQTTEFNESKSVNLKSDCSIDNDGDGYPASEDCDDNDERYHEEEYWYPDDDEDGYGSQNGSSEFSCGPPAQRRWANNDEDCNDSDPTQNPNTVWYYDEDEDGVGISTDTRIQCVQPPDKNGHPYVRVAGDQCPKDAGKISPGQCGCGMADTDDDNDGIANCNDPCPNNPNNDTGDADGDGIINCEDDCPDIHDDLFGTPCDDGDECTDDDRWYRPKCDCRGGRRPDKTWYRDADGDGYGNPNDITTNCSQPNGYVADNTDCDDNNEEIPTTPGNTCDDGDETTTNDVILSDGCTCAGTPVEPCDSPLDTDGDGTNDCDDECPENPALIEITDCGCGTFEPLRISVVRNDSFIEINSEITQSTSLQDHEKVVLQAENRIELKPGFKYDANEVQRLRGYIAAAAVGTNFEPITDAGQIGPDQTVCFEETQITIESITPAQAEEGFIVQYTWEYSLDNNDWQVDPNTTNTADFTLTLQQDEIYYKRVARVENCDIPAESNIVKITRLGQMEEVSAGPDVTVCKGECVTLSTNFDEDLTYTWNPGNHNGATLQICPTETATYTLVVEDEHGCKVTDDVIVTVIDIPTGQAPQTFDICQGEEQQLSASSGISYEWIPNDNTIDDATIRNPTVSPLVLTTYTVKIEVGNDCFIEEQFEVNVKETPYFQLEDKFICAGETVTFYGPEGNYQYEWRANEVPAVISMTKDLTITPTENTTYTLKVTNNDGGCISEQTVLVSTDEIDIKGPEFACDGEAITLSVGPFTGATYVWSNGATENEITLTAMEGVTDYSVTVTAETGCRDAVAMKTLYVSSGTVTQMPTTFGCGEITLTAPEGNSYLWEHSSETTQSIIVDGSTAATYTVFVDRDGCNGEFTFPVVPLPELSMVLNGTDPTCAGNQMNGQIVVDISGGGTGYTPEFSLDISGPYTVNQVFDNLSAGEYIVYARYTGYENCLFSEHIVLDAPEVPLIDLDEPSTTKFDSDTDTNIGTDTNPINNNDNPYVGYRLIIDDDNPPYHVNVDGPTVIELTTSDTIVLLGDLLPGAYEITVENADGCASTIYETIEEIHLLEVDCFSKEGVDCEPTRIGLTVTGGTLPYQITYVNPTTGETEGPLAISYDGVIEDLFPVVDRIYEIKVTDSGGKTGVCFFELPRTFENDVQVNYTKPSCTGFMGRTGRIDLLVNKNIFDTEEYAITWTLDGEELIQENGCQSIIENAVPGTYCFQVKPIYDGHENTCIAGECFTISPQPTFSVTHTVLYSGNMANIRFNIMGGNSPYSILQPNGEAVTTSGDIVLNNYRNGTHSFVISDALGCSTNYEVEVYNNNTCTDFRVLGEMKIRNPYSCEAIDPLGFIRMRAKLVPGGLSTLFKEYYWEDEDGNIIPETSEGLITGLVEGEYCFVAVNEDNCIAKRCTTLKSREFVQYFREEIQDECGGVSNGEIEIEVARRLGRNDTYTFGWFNVTTNSNVPENQIQNEQRQSTVSDLAAGLYEVTITNQRTGCNVTKAYTINEIPYFRMNFSNDEPTITTSCPGQPTGKIEGLKISGGSPPFEVFWTNYDEQPTIINGTGFGIPNFPAIVPLPSISSVSGGDHTVSVTDACGQTISKTFTVPVFDIEPLIINGEIKPGKEGEGEIIASIDGGEIGEYRLEWKDENGVIISNDLNATGLESGKYLFVVFDEEDCFQTEEFELINYHCGIPYLPFAFEARYGNPGPGPTNRFDCGGFASIIIDELNGSSGPYTLIISQQPDEMESGESLHMEQHIIEQPIYSTDPIEVREFDRLPRGIYQLKVVDACEENSMEMEINLCDPCVYDYDFEDSKFVLYNGGITIDLQCPCDNDCGFLGLKRDKLTFKFDESLLPSTEFNYDVIWPDGTEAHLQYGPGSKWRTDLGTDKLDYIFSDDDFGKTLNVQIRRNPDPGNDCIINIPITHTSSKKDIVILNEGVNDSRFLILSNGNTTRDYYVSNYSCEFCNPSTSTELYTDDWRVCTGDINEDFVTFFEYDLNESPDNNPCNGGGTLTAIKIDNSEDASLQEIEIPPANSPIFGVPSNYEHITNDWVGRIDPRFDCQANGGACVIPTQVVLGIELEKDILAQYCGTAIERPDKDGDGIPDIAELPGCECDDDIHCGGGVNPNPPPSPDPELNCGEQSVGACTETLDCDACIWQQDCPDIGITEIEGQRTPLHFEGRTESGCFFCFDVEICTMNVPGRNISRQIVPGTLDDNLDMTFIGDDGVCEFKAYCAGSSTPFAVIESCNEVRCTNLEGIANRELNGQNFQNNTNSNNVLRFKPEFDTVMAMQIIENYFKELDSQDIINPPRKEEFNLYPNPAINQITLEMTLLTERNVEVSIVNLLGAEVLSSSFNGTINQNKENLSIENLDAGIYLVQIKDQSDLLFTKKLIVVK